jgi:preprotein translocase subunit SecG
MTEEKLMWQGCYAARARILKRLAVLIGIVFFAASLMFVSVFCTLYFGVGGPFSPWWNFLDRNFFWAYGLFVFTALAFALASCLWLICRFASFFSRREGSH